jgi:diketogulonate reductase-like aldo/keto reductase
MTQATSGTMPIPRIIYGTAWKKDATERLVTTAIRQGFRAIDTACQPKHYNERGVGAGIAAALTNTACKRPDLFLQSKFTAASGQDPERLPYDPKAPIPQQVAQSCATSLKNLRTDYLDSLVLHSPLPSAKQTLEAWQAMESLFDSGAVRQLGISNCYQQRQLEALYTAARIKPTILQNRFYADTRYDRDLRIYCRNRQITYQSFWTLTANGHALAHPTVKGLALEYGRTEPQILFRYLTQAGITPLTGTTSDIHMREDLAIFEFELTPAERHSVDALF